MKIKDILARLAKPAKLDECAEISAILAQLDADVAAARATLAGIAEKRVAALKADDDKAIDGLDAAKLTAERVIEKASIARPAVFERLEAARAEARRLMIADYKQQLINAYRQIEGAVEAAIAANEAARAMQDEIWVKTGSRWPAIELPEVDFKGRLNREAVVDWKRFCDETLRLVTLPSERKATVAPPKPTPAKTASAPAKPTRAPKPKPVLAEMPVDGCRRMVVLKSGYESPEGLALAAGDFVDIPQADAHQAVMSGAVDYA